MDENSKDSIYENYSLQNKKDFSKQLSVKITTNQPKKSEITMNISKLRKMVESKRIKQIKAHEKFVPNFIVHGKELRKKQKQLTFQKLYNVFLIKLFRYFEILIVLTIITNTVILSMEDYRYRLSASLSDQWRNQLLTNTEIAFSSIYIAEFVIKTIGMGFAFEKGSYLRDSWNILDFIIVCSSILNILPIPIYFMGIKTLRILRPLRSINSVKGLKVLMSSLLESLPALGNVVLFLLFTIIIFSVIGLQLFLGSFAKRCRTSEQPILDNWAIDSQVFRLCSIYTCPKNDYCGSEIEEGILFNNSDLKIYEFMYGYATFDNMGLAIFTVFQALTTEGWSKFIYALIDGYMPAYVYIYYIILIMFGSFFMINLILAVIMDKFVVQQEQMKQIKPELTKGDASINGDDIDQEQNYQDDHNIEANENQYQTTTTKDLLCNNSEKYEGSQTQIVNIPSFKQEPANKSKPPVLLTKKQSNFYPMSLKLDIPKSKSQLSDQNDYQEKQYFKHFNPNYIFKYMNSHKQKQSQVSFLPKLGRITFEGIIIYSFYYFLLIIDFSKGIFNNSELTTQPKQDLEIQNEAFKIKSWKQMRTLTLSKAIKVKKVSNIFTRIIDSQLFLIITTVLILGNTVVLCMDRYPQSDFENNVLDKFNIFFTISFVVEMILKILGSGIRVYIRDRFNIFDTFIVVVSVIDFILSLTNSSQNLGILTAFRALRLFRIFKLARSWHTLRNLLSVTSHAFQSIQYFLVLTFIFVMISALIGMELFAYQVLFDDQDRPTTDYTIGTSRRVNFNTIYDSLMTIFILLTGESWNWIMYDNIRGLGFIYSIYFIAVMVIGNYILFKLCIAILIYNFSETSERVKQKKLEEKQIKQKQMLGKSSNRIPSLEDLDKNEMPDTPHTIISATSSIQNNKRQVVPMLAKSNNSNLLKKALQNGNEYQSKPTFGQQDGLSTYSQTKGFFQTPIQSGNQTPLYSGQQTPIGRSRDSSVANRGRNSVFTKNNHNFFNMIQQQQQAEIIEEGLVGNSLYIFPHTFSGRKFIYKVVFSNYFEYFIIVLILISCIILCLDDPFLDPDSQFSKIISYINFSMTFCFIIESLLRIIALGFIINGPNSYLRSFANVMDFLIVCLSSLDLFILSNSSVDLSSFKVIRILRILRPLRIISKNEGLKLAMNSLIKSLPSILNLQIIIGIVFLLFGMFGVNQFKGAYYYCSTVDDQNASLVDTMQDCFDLGGDWLNQNFNYDNIINAMTSLFILSTTEGWIERMQTGIDSRGIGLNRKMEYNKLQSLFFIGFVFVGSFFLINLFVGVICDSFQKEHQKQDGINNLTEQQNLWVNLYNRVLDSRPTKMLYVFPTASKIRKLLQKLIEHPLFEKIVMLCVVISTASFMLSWVNQDTTSKQIINIVNISFVYGFAFEAALKIIVYGSSFTRDRWNVLDLVIILITTAGVVIDYFNVLSSITQFAQFFILLRIIRIFRIVKKVKSLRIILNTIVISLPSLVNVGSLLFILLFMYSVLGMNLFAYVKVNDLFQDGLHEKANFQTIFKSFFTLLKISTGEEWDLLMDDLVKEQRPDFVCFSISSYEDYKNYGINGCGSWVAIPFIISFQILFSMIVLSLFIAVVLEGYSFSERDENSVIKPIQIEEFQQKWGKFDPLGISYFQARYLYDFMEITEYPFGWSNLSITESRKNLMMANLELPLYLVKNEKKPYINYYDFLERCALLRFQEHYGDFEFANDRKIKVIRDLMRKKRKLQNSNKMFYQISYTICDFVAVNIIQTYYQNYQNKQMNQLEQSPPLNQQSSQEKQQNQFGDVNIQDIEL